LDDAVFDDAVFDDAVFDDAVFDGTAAGFDNDDDDVGISLDEARDSNRSDDFCEQLTAAAVEAVLLERRFESEPAVIVATSKL
jgi:hypothetical protein